MYCILRETESQSYEIITHPDEILKDQDFADDIILH